jgi:PPOX class probable F420-dependent enzyme
MAGDLALVRRLAALERGLAVVAVARADGTVHASVVNAGVLDREAQPPAIAFVARGSARKLVHLRRRGQATVVFRRGWEWVAVEGPIQIVGPADVADLPALLRAVFIAAGGTHDDWPTLDRVMADEGRVAVLVAPQRFTSNG